MWPFKRTSSASLPTEGSYQRVLSLLELDEVNRLGVLPGEAIAGIYVDESHSLEAFRPNLVYVAFLHRVLSGEAVHSVDLIRAAEDMKVGNLFIIDWRTPDPSGTVPPEDIIGAIAVRDGRMVADSYKPNPNYRVLTKNGMTRLTPQQRSAFVNLLSRPSSSDT